MNTRIMCYFVFETLHSVTLIRFSPKETDSKGFSFKTTNPILPLSFFFDAFGTKSNSFLTVNRGGCPTVPPSCME